MVERIRVGGVVGVTVAVAVFVATVNRPPALFVGVAVGIGKRIVPVARLAANWIVHGVLLLFSLLLVDFLTYARQEVLAAGRAPQCIAFHRHQRGSGPAWRTRLGEASSPRPPPCRAARRLGQPLPCDFGGMSPEISLGGIVQCSVIILLVDIATIRVPVHLVVGVAVGIGECVVPVAGLAVDWIVHGVLLLFLVVVG